MSETTTAIGNVRRSLAYAIRANICERLVSWSLKIAPDGYVPSYIEVVIEAHRGNLLTMTKPS